MLPYPILPLLLLVLVSPRHLAHNLSMNKLERDKVEFIGRMGVEHQMSLEASVQIEIENYNESLV